MLKQTVKLTESWIKKPLGKVCKIVKGKKPNNSGPSSSDRTVPYINIDAFVTGHPKEYAELGAYPVCGKSDVLMVWDGARAGLVGRGVSGYIGSTLAKICSDVADSGYLFYFLESQYDFLNTNTKGIGIPHIDPNILSSIEFPVAPTNEQQRIVAEIETQFSRLDEAIANLKRVKANLKRYKAAVFKAAVEGKLTEEWRKQNPDVEPADKLLKRILAERRSKWEKAELAKMKAKGKVPKDDTWRGKYKEPFNPEMSDLSELPQKWSWVSADQLFWFVTSGSRGWAKYYSETGPVFIRIGNLDHNSISLDMEDSQRVQPPAGTEGTRTRVTENDILISITADVGMIAVVPNDFEEAYINQHIALARPVSSVKSSYVAWFLASRGGQKQLQDLQRGATKVGLGLDDIRSVYIPLPPPEEQRTIVAHIDQRLSTADEIERDVNANLTRAERLRQSILKKAFTGRLVPQDTVDESTGVAVGIGRLRNTKQMTYETEAAGELALVAEHTAKYARYKPKK